MPTVNSEHMAKGCAPNGRQSCVDLEHVGDLDDALGSVGTLELPVEPAEFIGAQTASRAREQDCQMRQAVMGYCK